MYICLDCLNRYLPTQANGHTVKVTLPAADLMVLYTERNTHDSKQNMVVSLAYLLYTFDRFDGFLN